MPVTTRAAALRSQTKGEEIFPQDVKKGIEVSSNNKQKTRSQQRQKQQENNHL